MSLCFALFETAIGPCAIAWGEASVVGVTIAEGDLERTRARTRRRWPDAVEAEPDSGVAAAIARVQALLEGKRDDLTDIPLDWSAVPDFDRRVLEICRAIPPGATRTYGDIARELGDLALSRGVGQALGRNPFPIIVPCHRVLGADGRTGGFSGGVGVETKLAMLNREGARASTAPTLFDDDPAFGLAAAPKR